VLDNHAVVSTTRSGADVIVRLAPSTELDLATAPLLASVLSDVRGGSCERVVVDLAGVDFIDSTGLRVLLVGQSALEADGIKLVLREPRPQALRLFDVAGVLDVMRIEAA
jgi:anti-sigma B factor antagonist